MTALVWFRTDLRAWDNTALAHAVKRAGPVRALFIATPSQWREHAMAPLQENLIYRAVGALQLQLADSGIVLEVVIVERFDDIPAYLRRYCRKHGIKALFANREYLLNEQRRDAAVEQALEVPCHWYDDGVLVPPGALTTGSGQPYRVFTPFARAWRAHFAREQPKPFAKPRRASRPMAVPALPAFGQEADAANWPHNEAQALHCLRRFCRRSVAEYRERRDFPALDGTSRLSPLLAIGLLSPRQCLARLISEQGEKALMPHTGAGCWLSELIWREFYRNVAWHFPRVVKGLAFKPETDYISWSTNNGDFQAWCEGRTGYPIVDAAMRQLNTTGWMHNRLRMISASFLVKDLHIDWRRGERYFMEHLIDGDFTSNNGGWQWAASTGTDAAPYFRIFNPTTQGRRFDPEGEFVRQFVPELAQLDARAIHEPAQQVADGTVEYPPPLVDHGEARKTTLALFEAIKPFR